MIFDQSVKPYLKREKFINSLHVNLPKEALDIPRRIDHIINLTKGKKVLHLGCCDHIPLIKEKINNGTWLHSLISEHSTKCVGIDIDKNAIDFVTNDCGVNNVIYGDIMHELPSSVKDENWDVIVLGEILEHIDNPVQFLTTLKENCPNVKEIIVSVPNVMNLSFFKNMKNGVEAINSDHRYWFTPYTLAMVMSQATLELDEIGFTDRIPLSKWELIKRKLGSFVGIEAKHQYFYSRSIVALGKLR
ncbi:MAG: methyltransferase domain-containing protein [Bacteroidia bacterium]|jgi:2-polyprenyl-3-methyl-5-hydroxy-6-metoxy-1,4-benzoquinol methylase|nr:methyltransferase domain-containing protein [Bacteroidia bacterium]